MFVSFRATRWMTCWPHTLALCWPQWTNRRGSDTSVSYTSLCDTAWICHTGSITLDQSHWINHTGSQYFTHVTQTGLHVTITNIIQDISAMSYGVYLYITIQDILHRTTGCFPRVIQTRPDHRIYGTGFITNHV